MMHLGTLRRTVPVVGLLALSLALNASSARSHEGPKGDGKKFESREDFPGKGKAWGVFKDKEKKNRGKHVGRPASCSTDADCKAEEFCLQPAGKCHADKKPKKDACSTDTDCEAGEFCHQPSGKCKKDRPCHEDADCGTSETCIERLCTPNTPEPQEICGDCLDNDGNGLIDFEDGACCNDGQTLTMALRRGKVVSRGATSKLKLASIIAADKNLTVTPQAQDLFIQIRAEGADADMMCARIPASRLDQKGRVYQYKGGKAPIATAKGLDKVAVKMLKNGTVAFKAKGRKAQIAAVHAGDLQLTLGFLGRAADAENRCSTTTTAFRPAGRAMVAVR